ncbi:efflux RND transporter periplasmic adaptor subunit [Pseudomonas amygdali]|uniref:efflux RND transporter periplasmic adaptor subunit n=1 Tax=Pseudomonas amygdali TaxID=47877 RepID=UPI001CD8AFDD|nr:efflux RND transporter periplasmic adaptor subunit [Pseudomonas amygdali]UBT80470.1 efflux RND transporter periplasmic adaptor subunit [Pseudomonas amygdali]
MISRQAKHPWAVLAIACAVFVAGCGEGGAPQSGPGPRPVAVEVVTVAPTAFAQSIELPGRIEPVRVAEVRARVAGIVLSRHFEEGADVKAGDVLFRIDPRPFQAALARARGELARAEAALTETQTTVRRYEPLVKIEAVSQQDFDAAQAAYQRAQAERESARANVETAQLDLQHATVTAPISGRVGRALVTEGALVGQGEATPMALVQQLHPVYADFRQPVGDVLRLREALAQGRVQDYEGRGARISITVDGISQAREGHLLFSDISVDRSTGQVSLRGQFDNADGLLLPGMYVRVQTPQGVSPQAVLVPQRAVRRSLDGKAQVLVVDQDSKAQPREVQTGAMRGSQWHIVSGLEPGDRVIVGGTVRPGAPVTVAAAAAASENTPPAPADASQPGR